MNTRWVMGSVVWLAVAAVGCSGAPGSADGGGGQGGQGGGAAGGQGGGAGGGTAGGASGVVVCPATAPADGTSCPRANLDCEYGGDPDPGCTIPGLCGANLKWSVDLSRGTCSSAGRSGCAASFGAVAVGASCSLYDPTDCYYPEGVCGCTAACGNPSRQWFCRPIGAGCPPPRPMRGTACSTEGLLCDYGGCLDSSLKLHCSQGIWQVAP